jgi:glycosyltransferase involved in cell wall biosynthesis
MFFLVISYPLGKLNISSIFASDVLKILNPQILNKNMANSDLIQIEQPWQFKHAYKNKPEGTPIVLVEHNVEFDELEQSISSKSILTKKLLKIAKEKERYAVENADAVFATSQNDMDRLTDEFSIAKTKVHVIPNGVDVSQFHPLPKEEQEETKEKLGLGKKKVILFTGGKHAPNYTAVEEILKMSGKIKSKDIIFLVAGRVRDTFENRGNVLFTGYVDDISSYFKAADIAINPMMSGSGTNLKMLEYLASGIPAITTKIGARGLYVENGKDVIISEIGDFPMWINNLLNDDDLYVKLRVNGRKLVEEKYDWKRIAEKQMRVYEKLLER